jgi:hypothetical protein
MVTKEEGGEQIIRGRKPQVVTYRACLSSQRQKDAQYQESVNGNTGFTGCDVLHSEKEN